MSRFLHHEPCPNCGSKDNLGVWEDGHKFCFGCKYYEPGTLDIRKVFSKVPEKHQRMSDYPYDAYEGMPVDPLKWMLNCGITFQQQKKYGLEWSDYRQMLVWKIRNPQGTIIGWQGRCFAKDAKTKYFIAGKIHEDICILGDGDEVCVLVEDYISAIRVSAHLPCMPLFGCICSLNVLNELRKRFKQVIVWLDSDKLDNARKIASEASMVGLGSQVCYTPKDPKNYSDTEIKNYLEVLK